MFDYGDNDRIEEAEEEKCKRNHFFVSTVLLIDIDNFHDDLFFLFFICC